jgi:hypothetical protein
MGTSIRAQERSDRDRAWHRPAVPVRPAHTRATSRSPAGGERNTVPFDFARTPLYSAQESGRRDPRDHDPVRKISASGDPRINITYTPDAGDQSTKIVFIQALQNSLDGVLKKPGDIWPAFSYQDKDTTATFWQVDYDDGENDPYYNGDDVGHDKGAQGNATSKPPVVATMSDKPNAETFPTGSSKISLGFRTASFSAAGPDRGTFYDYVDWTYAKEKGKTGKTTTGSTGSGNPGTPFLDAVNLWCKNHKFVLPSPAPAPAPGVFKPNPPPPPPPPK